MRISLLTTLAVGATFVAASPIRVEVVTVNEQIIPVPARFGHAVPQRNGNDFVATLVKTDGQHNNKMRIPCGRGRSRLRQQLAQLSSAFRKAIGLEKDEPRVLVFPFVMPGSTPGAMRETRVKEDPGTRVSILPYLPHPHPHHTPPHDRPVGGYRRFRERLAKAPFTKRLFVAIDTLGTWEGRAVAFVLGCGLGVLIRMVAVLCLVTYRAIRGINREQENYVFIVEDLEEAEAPPTYTDAEEKKSDEDSNTTN